MQSYSGDNVVGGRNVAAVAADLGQGRARLCHDRAHHGHAVLAIALGSAKAVGRGISGLEDGRVRLCFPVWSSARDGTACDAKCCGVATSIANLFAHHELDRISRGKLVGCFCCCRPEGNTHGNGDFAVGVNESACECRQGHVDGR